MTDDSSETNRLLRSAAEGDERAWGRVLTRHAGRLHRVVAFRLDRRLQGRIDASDVIQEVCLEALDHLADYLRRPEVPFFLWLRGVTANKLRELHRHHLGTEMRDAAREVAIDRAPAGEDTSAALAAQISAGGTRPSEAAAQLERQAQLQRALDSMDPLDREVLALRHFEHLSNAEAAQVIGIKEAAAGKRYLRALKRLKEILATSPGGLSGLAP